MNVDVEGGQAVGWSGGVDFEVKGSGPYEWTAWDEDVCVGSGKARTKIGLAVALWRAKWSIARRYS